VGFFVGILYLWKRFVAGVLVSKTSHDDFVSGSRTHKLALELAMVWPLYPEGSGTPTTFDLAGGGNLRPVTQLGGLRPLGAMMETTISLFIRCAARCSSRAEFQSMGQTLDITLGSVSLRNRLSTDQ
jgi:hypothetical protein